MKPATWNAGESQDSESLLSKAGKFLSSIFGSSKQKTENRSAKSESDKKHHRKGRRRRSRGRSRSGNRSGNRSGQKRN